VCVVTHNRRRARSLCLLSQPVSKLKCNHYFCGCVCAHTPRACAPKPELPPPLPLLSCTQRLPVSGAAAQQPAVSPVQAEDEQAGCVRAGHAAHVGERRGGVVAPTRPDATKLRCAHTFTNQRWTWTPRSALSSILLPTCSLRGDRPTCWAPKCRCWTVRQQKTLRLWVLLRSHLRAPDL